MDRRAVTSAERGSYLWLRLARREAEGRRCVATAERAAAAVPLAASERAARIAIRQSAAEAAAGLAAEWFCMLWQLSGSLRRQLAAGRLQRWRRRERQTREERLRLRAARAQAAAARGRAAAAAAAGLSRAALAGAEQAEAAAALRLGDALEEEETAARVALQEEQTFVLMRCAAVWRDPIDALRTGDAAAREAAAAAVKAAVAARRALAAAPGAERAERAEVAAAEGATRPGQVHQWHRLRLEWEEEGDRLCCEGSVWGAHRSLLGQLSAERTALRLHYRRVAQSDEYDWVSLAGPTKPRAPETREREERHRLVWSECDARRRLQVWLRGAMSCSASSLRKHVIDYFLPRPPPSEQGPRRPFHPPGDPQSGARAVYAPKGPGCGEAERGAALELYRPVAPPRGALLRRPRTAAPVRPRPYSLSPDRAPHSAPRRRPTDSIPHRLAGLELEWEPRWRMLTLHRHCRLSLDLSEHPGRLSVLAAEARGRRVLLWDMCIQYHYSAWIRVAAPRDVGAAAARDYGSCEYNDNVKRAALRVAERGERQKLLSDRAEGAMRQLQELERASPSLARIELMWAEMPRVLALLHALHRTPAGRRRRIVRAVGAAQRCWRRFAARKLLQHLRARRAVSLAAIEAEQRRCWSASVIQREWRRGAALCGALAAHGGDCC
eukprot:TRINITY_DN26555_c0_g1_i1.p1 TRINITY_DN26555_c0_g1~~TRINITY_DN26555_c0_g1_i1.p1  ORF type:complete len:668 (+),score=202.69 TRINITY_DN26555_c0_g1_i1:853-2856(+)